MCTCTSNIFKQPLSCKKKHLSNQHSVRRLHRGFANHLFTKLLLDIRNSAIYSLGTLTGNSYATCASRAARNFNSRGSFHFFQRASSAPGLGLACEGAGESEKSPTSLPRLYIRRMSHRYREYSFSSPKNQEKAVPWRPIP